MTSRSIAFALWFGVLGGCASDDSEVTLRDAVPTTNALVFPVPGTESSSDADGSRVEPLLGQPAVLYQLTRDTALIVNGSVLVAMAALQWVIATPPSRVSGESARWGPIPDRDNQLVYELYVESIGNASDDGSERYRFVFRGGTIDQSTWEYVDLLSGITELGPDVRRGSMSFDFDALSTLRPGVPGASGRVAARWDTGSYLEGTGPRRLDVTFDRFAGSPEGTLINATYRFEQSAPRSGRLFLETAFDLVATTRLTERVTLVSRWNESGGRSDARAAGGDLGLLSFGLVECWGPRFGRSYYRDTIDAEPEEGTVGSCVFADAIDP